MLLKMFRTPEFWYKTNIKSKLQIILFYPFSILWVLIDALKVTFQKLINLNKSNLRRQSYSWRNRQNPFFNLYLQTFKKFRL